jgi:hypothetical protein
MPKQKVSFLLCDFCVLVVHGSSQNVTIKKEASTNKQPQKNQLTGLQIPMDTMGFNFSLFPALISFISLHFIHSKV